ncbi:MAG: SWIM zinc finger family protein [Luteolibacter sp.]
MADLASKCSCPSRKFPCKHAIGLMFLATGQPAALTQRERPLWVVEWLDAHAAREQKAATGAAERQTKPVDEKAAAKRRAQKETRVQEGAQLLQATLLDLTREGLASGNARDASAWENLAKRMVDCQTPGLAGTLRHIGDTVLRDPEVDVELPFEMGRLHLLLRAFSAADTPNDTLRAEVLLQLGIRESLGEAIVDEVIDDQWFIAGRRVEERDRLITSSTWILGQKSRRWSRVLRFTPVQQAMVDPWPLGSTVQVAMKFQPGLYPVRATPESDGDAALLPVPSAHEEHLENLLSRFATALAANPFLRALPFFISLRPDAAGQRLVDAVGHALPWRASDDLSFRIECICAGNLTPVCGEWDGRHLRLLSILDGDAWIPLTPQQP